MELSALSRNGSNNKLRMFASLCVGATSLLAACGEKPSLDGSKPSEVVQKIFTPKHSEEEDGMCLMKSSGVCVLYDQNTVNYPNKYEVVLEQCPNGPGQNDKDACIQERIETTQEEYQKVDQGQVVTIDARDQFHVIPR